MPAMKMNEAGARAMPPLIAKPLVQPPFACIVHVRYRAIPGQDTENTSPGRAILPVLQYVDLHHVVGGRSTLFILLAHCAGPVHAKHDTGILPNPAGLP